jgi:hypothetical protein
VFTSVASGVARTSELTLVVNPEDFQQSESSTSSVILSAGDVYADTYGPGLTKIKMSGTFGQRPAAGSGSGQLEALRLRQFFRKYLDEVNPITTPDPTVNAGAKLQFFNPKDNEYWDIEIPGEYLTISRSKASPFLYRYSLSFIAMTPSRSAGLYDVLKVLTSGAEYLKNTDILSTVADISTYAQEISTTAVAIGLGTLFFPNQVAAPFNNLANSVTNCANGVTSLINYPYSGLNQLIADCNTMLQAIGNTQSAHIQQQLIGIDDGYVPNSDVENTAWSILNQCDTLTLYPNLFNTPTSSSTFTGQPLPQNSNIPTVNIQNVTGVTYGKVVAGDSIESLAIKGMGDINQWKLLADFNNLQFPFIYIVDSNDPTDSQPEKTLGVGMNIAFPKFGSSSTAGSVLGANPGGPDTSDFAFGTDLLLDSTNDISIGHVNAATLDFLSVSGVSNLLQAVEIKFNVLQGELMEHQNFGLPNLLGYRTLGFITAMATSAIKSTLSSDPRVKAVTNIQVTLSDDTLNYSCLIQPNFISDPFLLEGTIGGNLQTA